MKLIKYISIIGFAVVVGILLMPMPSFRPAYSHILYSQEGELLSASISSEGQWCFVLEEELPEKLATSIILFEDAYYHYHLGVNPISVLKALKANAKSKRIKRGGSTIPMQVMRMKNRNANRSYKNKILETLAATKYSLLKSKKSILKEWASMAPFGGNIIGAKAASLLYFGRELDNLSWSEYALLAVMPNAPSKMHLNKNRKSLLDKRNFLLRKLHKAGYISMDHLPLYLDEELPSNLHELPQKAFHFMEYEKNIYPSKKIIQSTLSYDIQSQVDVILHQHAAFLQREDIRNLAAVVIDIKSNEVKAYVGNVKSKENAYRYVDIVQSPRSYGSLLKPLLYNYAIEKGYMTPHELVEDIPTEISGFRPKNFDKKYRGAVPFDEALIKSLNVPAVRVLNRVGLTGFYDMLEGLDLQYLDKGVDHYGLSVILGGGESTLWEMCRLYKGFAQNLTSIEYPYREVKTLVSEKESIKSTSYLSPISLYHTASAMSQLVRPKAERSWDHFTSHQNVAWKTGTSYGHKDAWSIGFNADYVVGVWVGNEDAEGRFNLTGVTKAAPIMFEIFNNLPTTDEWFRDPSQRMKGHQIQVCKTSGKLIGGQCQDRYTITLPSILHKLMNCTHHSFAHDSDSVSQQTFTLPPYQAYFYHQTNIGSNINLTISTSTIKNNSGFKIIYPLEQLKIFLPKESSSFQNDLIVKGYHPDPQEGLFWYIDDTFIGKTVEIHKLMTHPTMGVHTLTAIDSKGEKERSQFEIIEEYTTTNSSKIASSQIVFLE